MTAVYRVRLLWMASSGSLDALLDNVQAAEKHQGGTVAVIFKALAYFALSQPIHLITGLLTVEKRSMFCVADGLLGSEMAVEDESCR